MNYTQIDLLARMEYEAEKERLADEMDFDEMEFSNETDDDDDDDRWYYDATDMKHEAEIEELNKTMDELEKIVYETDFERDDDRWYYGELIKRFPNIIKVIYDFYDPERYYSSQFHMEHNGITVNINFRDCESVEYYDEYFLKDCSKRDDEIFIFIQKQVFQKADPSILWSLLTAEINQSWKDAKAITFGIDNYFDKFDEYFNKTESDMVRHYLFDKEGNYLSEGCKECIVEVVKPELKVADVLLNEYCD